MIQDLGIILLTAGVTSLLCKFLKQPVVLGYIVAGLLVGPYAFGASWLNNVESVNTWGEVGVIFLLFSLGLEFSFKKMVKIGSTAIIACLTVVIGMMVLGFLLGRALGWNQINSLFLGGMLSMSSDTIVFKVLDDLGMRQQKFASTAFGILIAEDLVAVVLMVLLASIAVKQSFDSMEMLTQVVKLVACLLFWFVAGLSLIPTLLRVCRKHLNDETLTIVALGLCLGMVMLAEAAGFSSALGAFVMGSILAETVEAEHIGNLIDPVKNIFGAVFFVSVGMMIDPALLLEYWWPITIITIMVLVGHLICDSAGVLLAGQSLKVAIQTAFSLAQVGEFAFIIANFGSEKGVTEPFLYPVIVAVSVITTFLTPYSIKISGPFYEWVDKILPRRIKLSLDHYGRMRNVTHQDSLSKQLYKKLAVSLTLYFVVGIFIVSLYFSMVNKHVIDGVESVLSDENKWVGHVISLAIVLVLITPILYQLANKDRSCEEVKQIWNSGSRHRGGIVAFNITRVLLSAILIISCVFPLFDATGIVMLILAAPFLALLLKSPEVRRRSQSIEANFMKNLSAREQAMREGKTASVIEEQTGGSTDDLHFEDVPIPDNSTVVGRSLVQMDLRNSTGVSVIRIMRSTGNINTPVATECFKAGDKVTVSGSLESIELFKFLVDAPSMED